MLFRGGRRRRRWTGGYSEASLQRFDLLALQIGVVFQECRRGGLAGGLGDPDALDFAERQGLGLIRLEFWEEVGL